MLFLANLLVAAFLAIIALAQGWRPVSAGAGLDDLADSIATATQLLTDTRAPPTSALAASPTLTPAPTPSFIPTITRTPSNTPTPVTTHGFIPPTSTPEFALPDQARVSGVVGHAQTLSLSCESRSAADWAGFFGFSIDELEFFSRLPVSNNPDTGFVGDVNGKWGQTPPDAYGAHADPVAALLREYGVSAEARHGMTWDDLRGEIAAGRPVVAWVVGHVTTVSQPLLYTAPDGSTAIVAPYEHTVLVTGYTSDRVLILDGAKIYYRPLEMFLGSWGVLGNMAIVAGR
ncbi:MAG: C39 family peptidase [Chloroflexota bacterium]